VIRKLAEKFIEVKKDSCKIPPRAFAVRYSLSRFIRPEINKYLPYEELEEILPFSEVEKMLEN